MTIRSTVLGGSKLFLLLVAAVTANGVTSPARASDAAAQNYLQTLTDADVTGNVNARATPAATSVMVSHARAARALFGEARASLDRALLLTDASPTTNVGAVDAAMKNLRLHLEILAITAKPRTAAVVKKASAQVEDWYASGLKVIKPSTDGVLELPSPVTLQAKADAASASLEQVIEDAVGALKPIASAPAQRNIRANKRRPQPASAATQPVGDSTNWQFVLGLHRDTHY
jgi:hypothetical protein